MEPRKFARALMSNFLDVAPVGKTHAVKPKIHFGERGRLVGERSQTHVSAPMFRPANSWPRGYVAGQRHDTVLYRNADMLAVDAGIEFQFVHDIRTKGLVIHLEFSSELDIANCCNTKKNPHRFIDVL
jgi:hypothetical protein